MYLLKRKIKDLVRISVLMISYLELFYLQIPPRIMLPHEFFNTDEIGHACPRIDSVNL